MRSAPWICGLLGLCLGGMPMLGAASSDPLAVYGWDRRLLLVFASSADDPRASAMRDQLERRRCAVAERDLTVAHLHRHGASRLGAEILSSQASTDLWRRLGPAPGEGFRVVLIGKDGGVKRQHHEVPDLQALFAHIDDMPMRRAELAELTSGRPGCP